MPAVDDRRRVVAGPAGPCRGQTAIERPTAPGAWFDRLPEPAVLAIFVVAALALRTIGLGLTFRSADEGAVAARILLYPGCGWMFRENYGLLINLLVKLWAAGASGLGIGLTEFWWKLPVALAGTLQVPLAWAFLKSLGARRFGRLFGAAMIAVLPIHVMWSRYLWGYDVLGLLALLLFFQAGRKFFEAPTRPHSAAMSLAAGVYLISHGYVLPFLPTLFIAVFVWTAPHVHMPALRRLGTGAAILLRSGIWIFPALVLPFCVHPLAHTLRKPTRPGFYVFSHLPGFIGNIGLAVAVLLLIAPAGFFALKGGRRRDVLPLAAAGFFYLVPLFLGTPPGITDIRSYMMIGTVLWVLAAVLIADDLAKRGRRTAVALTLFCVLVTAWGTVETVFGRDRWFDPAMVVSGRGGTSADPGVKAAGYLLRRHLDPDTVVLAIHRNIEPLNLYYYAGREGLADYDLTLDQTRLRFERDKGRADVIICDADQVAFVRGSGEFVERVVIISERRPRLWMFASPGVPLPELTADARELNKAYDKAYSPRVRLWRP